VKLLLVEIPYLDVSLTGLTVNEINDLREKFEFARIELHKISDAYFYLLSKEAWKTPDAIDESTVTINEKSYLWKYSFNEAKNNLPILEQNYITAANNHITQLPFYTQILIKLNKIEMLTSNEIILSYEIKYFGDRFDKFIKKRIEHYNIYQENLITAEHNYWTLYRKKEQDLAMCEKYKAKIFGKTVRLIKCPSMIDGVFNDSDIVEARNNLNTAKRNYEQAISDENFDWENYFGRYPFEYALYTLPEKPIRPTIDEIEAEIISQHPPLGERELTDEEQWNWERLQLMSLASDKYIEAEDYISNICISSEHVQTLPQWQQDICWKMVEQRDIAERNYNRLKRKKYKQDLYANLEPYP